MKKVKKILRSLLGRSKTSKIHSEFGNVLVRTTTETAKVSNKRIKDLIICWCVSLPRAYFEGLFIDDNTCNRDLLAILDNAEVLNGTDCALITQAFCLYELEQVIKSDINYQKLSMMEIEQVISSKLSRGTFIIQQLNMLRERLKGLTPDEWCFEYIHEILNLIYIQREKTFSLKDALNKNSKLKAWLFKSFEAFVKRAKQADAQTL
jgi:hypothetical protein